MKAALGRNDNLHHPAKCDLINVNQVRVDSRIRTRQLTAVLTREFEGAEPR